MFVLVLSLMLSGKQEVYTGAGQEPIRFATFEDCAARAKVERERVKHLVRGEFMLSCVAEDALRR